MSLLEKKFKDDSSQEISGDEISKELELSGSYTDNAEKQKQGSENKVSGENSASTSSASTSIEVGKNNDFNNDVKSEYGVQSDYDYSQNENRGNNLLNRTYSSRVLIIAVLFIAVLFFIIYSLLHRDVHREKADSPRSTAKLLSQILAEDDYEAFKKLFADSSSVNEKLFADSRDQLLGESIVNEYVIITKDDGRMFLLALKKTDNNKRYKIRFIKEIPTDIRQFFNDKAESKVDSEFEDLLNSKGDKVEDRKDANIDESDVNEESDKVESDTAVTDETYQTAGKINNTLINEEKSSKSSLNGSEESKDE